ncbi:MAG: hypothetical protein EB101_08715 [Chitinophagia bacterium]|nr:hypothetical protein [Chitinophagia bacterium]
MGEVSKANRYLMEVLRLKVRIRPLRYRLEERWFRNYRIPIDQTRRGALAQIQVVSQKIF